jgi:hypothetical protein
MTPDLPLSFPDVTQAEIDPATLSLAIDSVQ